ncbi:hypothetical protein GCM10007047_12250 [Cerasicoccus arenae]|uniref:DUF1559 domain-containing protein n=2 Tax=Cerasicoccus arenae TaxID=424488 RepID=A0A8J3DGM9_9BACT|nr:hypothetical protein GCM10007047_12250 [Cerasicoccus arenae]
MEKYPSLRGFTLVELLTVVAIIGVLSAILIPTIGSVRASARAAQGASNLRQMGVGMQAYAADHQGFLPRVTIKKSDWNKEHPDDQVGGDQMWTKLLRDYLPQQSGSKTGQENQIFVCPNAEYTKSNGELYESDKLSRTYTATETLFGIRVLSSGTKVRDSKTSRSLATIEDPSKTLLVLDGKQSGTTGGCASSTIWSQVQGDLNLENPDSSSYLDFRQPSDSINVLFVDGRVSRLGFQDLSTIEEKQWHGRL